MPKICLNALWLNELEFSAGKQIEVDHSMEHLKIRLSDSNKSFKPEEGFKGSVSTSSGGRASDGKIRIVPHIRFYGIWLTEIGFKIEDTVIVTYDHGVIDISLLKP